MFDEEAFTQNISRPAKNSRNPCVDTETTISNHVDNLRLISSDTNTAHDPLA
jgi:hypothetical protein